MDLDCVSASPGGRWIGETAARRRQRRLSSPSLRAYLTPAFDAVAGGEGGMLGSSSSSSGGLDLGFDASLLRFRRAHLSASTGLDGRLLFHSPQSPPARALCPVADEEVVVAGGGGRYVFKLQAGGPTGAPGLQDLKDCSSFISPQRSTADIPIAAAQGSSNSIKLPADLRSPEEAIKATKAELATPKPEAEDTPSVQATCAHAEPTKEEDDLITEFLYAHRGGRRLPIFREICPE